MAVEGGQGQPAAPNMPEAAMNSILPEVRRKEEGKSRRGRAGAGAADVQEQRSAHRRTGADRQGRERAGGGVRGQACGRAPRGERGTPTLVQAAAAGVAPTGQCGGGGGGGEQSAPPADGTVGGTGAHRAPAPSPPSPGARARHHLLARDGVGERQVGAPGRT